MRSFLFTFVTVIGASGYAYPQAPCPVVNFKNAVPEHAGVLARQADGTYTDFELTSDNPPKLIRSIANYGKTLTGCVAKSGRPNINLTTLPGPSAVGPDAVLKSGNFLFFLTTSSGLENKQTEVNVLIYDTKFNLVSNRPYTFPVFQSAFFADVTGDGNPDLVATLCDSLTGNCGSSIYSGNPDGSFALTSAFSVNGKPLLATDLNGDGLPDLLTVASNLGGSSVIAYYGQAKGGFGAPVNLYAFALQAIVAAAAGDLNLDGTPDLVLTGNGMVLVGINDGHGGFPLFNIVQGIAGIPAIGDVNGDGFPDIVTGSILLGDGKGAFVRNADYALSGILMDFDGDGILDILSGQLVQFGLGDGTFWAASALSAGGGQNLVAADLNGDGFPDLLVWDSSSISNSSIKVYLADRNMQFRNAFTYSPIGYLVVQATSGDFNNDGKQDLLLGLYGNSGALALLIGNGDGTFQAPIITPGVPNMMSLTTGDFNGDGKLDAAYVTAAAVGYPDLVDSLQIQFGKGDGSFQRPVAYPAGPTPMQILSADFHGKGITDLVVGNRGTNVSSTTMTLYTGKGDGTFSPPGVLPVPSFSGFPLSLLADFNLDGRPDLAVGGWILLGQGGGTFSVLKNVAVNSPTLVSDINGDKIPDLVGAGMVFFGEGDGTFQAGVPLGVAALAAADFNRDGRSDVVDSNDYVYFNVSQTGPPFTVVSAGSNSYGPLAPESLATAYGNNLSGDITVTDAVGISRPSDVLFSSPTQMNFEIPEGTATGQAQVQIGRGLAATVYIQPVAPALFSNNNAAVGYLDLVGPDGSQTLLTLDPFSYLSTAGAAQAYLVLYGTGLRGADGTASATLNGTPISETYVGPAPGFIGLDQVNLLIPIGFSGGSRIAPLAIMAGGIASNIVSVLLQ